MNSSTTEMKFVPSYPSLYRALATGIFLCAFSFLLHAPGNWSLACWPAFTAAAWMMSRTWLRNPGAVSARQLWAWKNRLWQPVIAGMVLAATAAIRYRQSEGMSILPLSAGYFVWISILIGLGEELLFRGFIQGDAAQWNPAGAVFVSSLFFAFYKSLLFVFPGTENLADPLTMFYASFPAGLLLGYARYYSSSLWPCLFAHGLFDLWVYMDTPSAPWWVW